MVPRNMENTENDDRISFYAVKNPVRKFYRENSTESSIENRESFRIRFKVSKRICNRDQKPFTKAKSLILVPIVSATQVRSGSFTNENNPSQALREDIEIRTSRQGWPRSPSRSNSRSAASSSFRSSTFGAAPSSRSFSCNSQRRSKIRVLSSALSLGSSAKISALLTRKAYGLFRSGARRRTLLSAFLAVRNQFTVKSTVYAVFSHENFKAPAVPFSEAVIVIVNCGTDSSRISLFISTRTRSMASEY
jgi:hypothetical protein